MALTAEQEQQLILQEYGCSDDATIAANMPLWWEKFSGDGQENLVRRAVLTSLAGKYRSHMDVGLGPDRIAASQLFRHVMVLLADINRILGLDQPAQGMVSGTPDLAIFCDGSS